MWHLGKWVFFDPSPTKVQKLMIQTKIDAYIYSIYSTSTLYIRIYIYWYLQSSFLYIYIHFIYIFIYISIFMNIFLCFCMWFSLFWNMLTTKLYNRYVTLCLPSPSLDSRLGAYGLEFGRSAVRGDGPKSQDCGAGDHQRHAQRTFG